MLVVIDMQNQIRDENSQSFISDSPAFDHANRKTASTSSCRR